jgi:cell division protein FtsW
LYYPSNRYFVGGGRKTHIAGIILIGMALFVIMLQFKPYQMNRLRCFVDPSFSSNDICYQINQSLIAVGSGGIFGRGLGESRQKYMYLPEVSGDSIFAIIAEETGFIVSTLLIILFLIIFYRGYKISLSAPDDFGRILAIGISSWISIQAFINIGGIINLMPMTGVPLPLISYGGSAILSSLAAFGILINISSQGRR